MTSEQLARIVKIGRKVDPIILKSLVDAAPSSFRPSVSYHFRSGGKRMRAALVLLTCAASGGKIEHAMNPAAVVEMIHNYSLVMDDLIDHGLVRRGKPTVRVHLGDSVALLVAMLYREVLDDLIEKCVFPTKIRKVAVQAMKEIIEGERLDLMFEQAGREDPYLKSQRIMKPSFPLYLKMIGKKTAALFKASSEIGAYSARANQHVVLSLGEFGWKAGLAFQIMDDVLDICGEATGKEIGKDVMEHKLGNAAILTALRYLPQGQKSEILAILRSTRVSRAMAIRARQLVMETSAEKDCREIAEKYLHEARANLSVLKDSISKEGLATLANEIVARTF